jgi:PAS domain S-box-containing protein
MASLDLRQSTIFSRLRGLLEVTRLVRTSEELPELLSAIARTVSDSLAFRTVVVNLYRPEWDDYVVATVYGSDEAREALLGQVRQVSDWEPLLDQRFLQRGAYLVPSGEFDWTGHLDSFTPDLPVSDDPNAWHPDDALFAPMRGADGQLLGILSVDEPISGRKPSGDEIDVLVAVSEHAALAVQSAQESARAKANREALAHLLAVSARLNESTDTKVLLTHVCEATSEALGFEKVAVQLLDRATGTYQTAAEAGFEPGENLGLPLRVDQVDILLGAELVEDCLLLPGEVACGLIPDRTGGYRSRLNGRGPRSWQNHWLFVPLFDRRGGRVGYIWADDPIDRLQPEPERLHILRAFANQAMTALEQAAQFEAIQNSNAHQRALIDASPVAIVDFDFDGRIRSWNAGAADMFGWSAEEVNGRVSPIVPADDLAFFLSNIERVRDTGDVLRDLDLRRIHRDGAPIDVSTSAGPIRNAQGEVIGVIALMVDVTARKRSERALATSEGRKDAILRAALDSVVIVDHEGLVVEVNPATEETFGWTRSDMVGKSFLELVVAGEHRVELSEVLDTGTGPLLGARLEIKALRSDQRAFPAELAITRVDVPGPNLFAVSLRDVTKRRQREERLREAEAKYRTLVEQLPIATYINDTGMPVRTRYMSPQIETILGFPVSDWLTGERFFLDHVHPDDRERIADEVQRTHETGENFRLEYRMIAADGSVVWLLDETVAVRDEEYRPLFLQGYLMDVTERRATDDALRTSEDLYRLVVEGSRDIVAVVDLDGIASYVSPSVQSILGYTGEELAGRPFGGIVDPADLPVVQSYLDARAANLEAPSVLLRARHKDGRWITLDGTAHPMSRKNGEPQQFVCILGAAHAPQRAALRPAAA